MEITNVLEIHELAQEFMDNPKIKKKGNNLVLVYDYETESGEYEWTGITFLNTIKHILSNNNSSNNSMFHCL